MVGRVDITVHAGNGLGALNLQGDAQMTLAQVLELGRRSGEAADATRRALDRYARKGQHRGGRLGSRHAAGELSASKV